ncbi:hypothetical protein L6164_010629 [Bauhinia variegata]|uniref:Uncharacterized protein n=1 Tax=Bauhinia variegata TaxID=167791 RepID=A0ACB9PN00_BAUVA|nr:hypothetical protein L6164_010629 [Bauhinia variegata]
MVPEGVRLEAQTDYVGFVKSHRCIYNLERKAYEAAVRGPSPVESPLPVQFPLPDQRDPFSLKPGCISLLLPNLTAPDVDSSSSLSLAIAGARVAAAQFSKEDHSSQSTIEHSAPLKMNNDHEEEKKKNPITNDHEENL